MENIAARLFNDCHNQQLRRDMTREVGTVWCDRIPKESKLKILYGNVQTRDERIEVCVNKRYIL